MADVNLNAAPRPYAHPQASPGYGKRGVPGQHPRRKGDFAALPVREAYLAAFIDALPDGSAIDVKSLARTQPLYGQQAVASALRALSRAGHLRRFKENVGVDGRTRWVWRTFFSRTARDGAWWARLEAGDAMPEEAAPEPEPEPASEAAPGAARSAAYDALASLGRADHRLVLSAAECAALEREAAVWLERGTDRAQFVRAMTAGLPPEVYSAGGFVRRRLRDKLPPEPPAVPDVAPRRVMVCTGCGKPGGPQTLPDGLCGECRSLPPEDVRDYVRGLRELCR
ncbi:hypothetical protein [Streptomyces sp. DW26H14]|uniref:hypothetical protein n=1 Tax=Streptomyces sp. DW26H14 TaxID=3435395 RepID=UPI00403DE87E